MAIRYLITKKVLSIYDSEVCGYVLGIKFGEKMQKINSLIIVNEDEDVEYTLKISDVISIENDYVTIRNKSKLVVTMDNKMDNLNSDIVGINGVSYGTIEDLEIGKNYKINKILCKNAEFLPKNILCVGENVIIVNDTGKNYNRSNFAPLLKVENTKSATQSVEILPHNTLPTPVRVNNTATLLGRRLARDLLNSNGEIIARKNSIITIPIINSAKQFNIMAELVASVK